ncbi:MAG: PHP domain-containing protein [Lachnospiraceae bacterium]|nr:PHP domain-containing protein [Lachnospiraceae bacterium]
MYLPKEREAFHVHTWRCGHAGNEKDEEYIERAIELGATRIVFTDHAPFPGNPFPYRMDMELLSDYVHTMNEMKQKYQEHIEVLKGLEIEYLPGYLVYYEKLRQSGDYDLLMLGQHFYQRKDGTFSYDVHDYSDDYVHLCKAMAEGIRTGFFDVLSHPDRVFGSCESWEEPMAAAASEVIAVACEYHVPLEINYSSRQAGRAFRQEFWDMVPSDARTIQGLDAHCVRVLAEGYRAQTENI